MPAESPFKMSSYSALIGRASPSGSWNGTAPTELPAENGIHVWRAAVATPFFTFIFVALRLYTRTHILRSKYTFADCATLPTADGRSGLTLSRCSHTIHGRMHCPRGTYGQCNVQWHGPAYMAIRPRAQCTILPVDWHQLPVLCAGTMRLQMRADTAVSTAIRREHSLPMGRLQSPRFLCGLPVL